MPYHSKSLNAWFTMAFEVKLHIPLSQTRFRVTIQCRKSVLRFSEYLTFYVKED